MKDDGISLSRDLDFWASGQRRPCLVEGLQAWGQASVSPLSEAVLRHLGPGGGGARCSHSILQAEQAVGVPGVSGTSTAGLSSSR